MLPGEDNVMADALSRSLDQLSSAVIVKQATLVSATNTDSNLSIEWQALKRGKRVPSEAAECQQLIANIHSLGHFSVESMFRQLWQHGCWWWPKI